MDEINQTWCEKIGDYLSGEMTAEERSAFESEMARDKELSAVFSTYSTIETEMRKHEQYIESESALKKTLNEISTHYSNTDIGVEHSSSETEQRIYESPESRSLKEESKIKKIKTWKWLAVAAAISGIIVLSVTWYLQNEAGKQQVAANNKKTDSSTSSQKPDTNLSQKN